MLQLLGGVAVAGAVAAGSTAFTGGGVTNGITGQKSFLGGTVQHQVVGAQLTAMDFTTVDTTDATNGTHVTAFKLTFDANTPTGSHVTISALQGTPSSAAADNFYCTVTNASYESTCTAGVTGTPGGYFTGVGTFKVTVLAP